MILVLSPAKTLDFSPPTTTVPFTQPDLTKESEELIRVLRRKTKAEIALLMGISDALATLNVARYKTWHRPFTIDNAKPAILAFNGDVYEGLAATTLNAKDLAFAQTQVRILSGLYGVLRPLDLIQPYRLEMGTRLATRRSKDLYGFWGDRPTEAINRLFEKEIQAHRKPVLINLASDEYFKALRPKHLEGRVITPVFQEIKNGQGKVISFFAKRARGLMTRFVIQKRLKDPEQLKLFDGEGYGFDPQASTDDRWIFRRAAR